MVVSTGNFAATWANDLGQTTLLIVNVARDGACRVSGGKYIAQTVDRPARAMLKSVDGAEERRSVRINLKLRRVSEWICERDQITANIIAVLGYAAERISTCEQCTAFAPN